MPVVTLYGGPAAGQAYEVAEPPPEELLVPIMPEVAATFATDAEPECEPVPYRVAVYRRSPWCRSHYHHERTYNR